MGKYYCFPPFAETLSYQVELHFHFLSENVFAAILLVFVCYCFFSISNVFIFHIQNTRETAHAIRKLPLTKAKRYLEDVLAHKQAIPFTRFCRGVGRTAQAKNRHSNGQGRWPVKSAKFILDLLKNAESNAEVCIPILFFFGLVLSVLPLLRTFVGSTYSVGERFGRGFTSHISHPGQPSTEAEASHIPCPWENQP